MGDSLWIWAVFLGLIGVLLTLDLGILNRSAREIPARKSLALSAFYIAVGFLFGAWIWLVLGAEKGEEYLTGFVIEKTLALDNIFLVSLIFAGLGISKTYQHRVLFWGILGVLVLRAVMIALGAAVVAQFSWLLYVFGFFLVLMGIKMLLTVGRKPDIESNRLFRFLKKHLRMTRELHGEKFFVRLPSPGHDGKTLLFATPLFLALLQIEFVDFVFAIDSIPAIFAITTDPYIVYTSNIFAVLGLRALYFALDSVIHRFRYLKYSFSAILVFIGAKIFVADIIGLEKFPAWISLTVTVSLILGGVAMSLAVTRRKIEAARM